MGGAPPSPVDFPAGDDEKADGLGFFEYLNTTPRRRPPIPLDLGEVAAAVIRIGAGRWQMTRVERRHGEPLCILRDTGTGDRCVGPVFRVHVGPRLDSDVEVTVAGRGRRRADG